MYKKVLLGMTVAVLFTVLLPAATFAKAGIQPPLLDNTPDAECLWNPLTRQIECGNGGTPPPPPPPPPIGQPPPPPPVYAACSNGVDDDSDGKVDYPADQGCTDYGDPDEWNPAPAPPPPPPPAPAPPPPPAPTPPPPPPVPACDEYDAERNITYTCTADGDFYTPDNIDPDAVWTGNSGGCNPYSGGGYCKLSTKPGTDWLVPKIPPPAAYKDSKNYCSFPSWTWTPYEWLFNFPCYQHDVCYGSQLNRQYCDSQLYKGTSNACRARYAWWEWTPHFACLATTRTMYTAIRCCGESHYVPRKSSLEP
jgi:hypothetical protein